MRSPPCLAVHGSHTLERGFQVRLECDSVERTTTADRREGVTDVDQPPIEHDVLAAHTIRVDPNGVEPGGALGRTQRAAALAWPSGAPAPLRGLRLLRGEAP